MFFSAFLYSIFKNNIFRGFLKAERGFLEDNLFLKMLVILTFYFKNFYNNFIN